MGELRFSPDVLDWAASQAGTNLSALAARVSKRGASKIEEGQLTDAQALKFSKLAGVPFGYLFLAHPPNARALPIADFRTPKDADALDRNFYEVYDDIVFKQAWYKEYLKAIGAASLDFVGRFANSQSSAEKIADDIRQTLGISGKAVATLRNADEHFSYLAERCENVGIMVFKNGIVANNTHRPLSERQFRGFVLSDDLAPMIFINGADFPAAWVFTLSHELAHIWFGESGVSDTATKSSNASERRCNAIAAELLVPSKVFRDVWAQSVADAFRRIDRARLVFKVSALVIARKALDEGLISQHEYDAVLVRSKNASKSREGGDFYRTLSTRNSRTFAKRVASLAASGTLTYREAGRLLNVSPRIVPKFHARSK